MMTKRTERLEVRLTPQEQSKIERNAERCGISISEYVRQRCLGYAPSAVSPDAVQAVREPLFELLNRPDLPPGCEAQIESVLDDLREVYLLPRRDL